MASNNSNSNSNSNSNPDSNSNSNSNSNPDQNQIRDRMRERREDQLLFQRFTSVATVKLEELSRQIQLTKQSTKSDETNTNTNNGFGIDIDIDIDINTNIDPFAAHDHDLKFGEEEQRILSNLTGMGVKEGLFASLASFIILRRGPKYIGRWMQRRNQNRQSSSSSSSSSNTQGGTSSSSSSYKLSDPAQFTNNNTGNNPFHRAANPNRNDFPRRRGFFSRSVWFVFDSVLSLMVGANVSVIFTDKVAIQQQIIDLPLVSGRSLAADSLCDEIVEELRKVREEKNPSYERLQKISRGGDSTIATTDPTATAASYYLDGIILFCQNCERRRYLERRIRDESGLGRTVPVEIPIPGVPRDGPRLVALNGEEERVIDKDGIEDPFADQFDRDTQNWAKDLVLDRNDSDRGRGM
eukprot:CAMPEP_0168223180 /NCGR_PEP_ID=MMETSP0140_2-20121125/11159_1 /TAXON_ID=44445 /ORGANISM="Pseudo-nitzschia australis, Strain 10249 10 AB" /LENGTH=409 /DNA_ID=CAMNT_0008153017 /DNA_START=159 /DNA_END=1388 /DNA_ORIENTATION=-